jgi:hypothetical protein
VRPFREAGVPAVLQIENLTSDFNPYYHGIGDTVAHMDHDYFIAQTRSLVASMTHLAGLVGSLPTQQPTQALPTAPLPTQTPEPTQQPTQAPPTEQPPLTELPPPQTMEPPPSQTPEPTKHPTQALPTEPPLPTEPLPSQTPEPTPTLPGPTLPLPTESPSPDPDPSEAPGSSTVYFPLASRAR